MLQPPDVLFDGVVSPAQAPYEGEPQGILDHAPTDPTRVRFTFEALSFAMGEQTAWSSPGVLATVAADPEGSGAWGLVVVFAGGPPELQPASLRVVVTEDTAP